jgi:hypothetical protein
MTKYTKNTYSRPLTDKDSKLFLKMKLKKDDALELENMLGITQKEYLSWHLSEHKDNTKVFYHKNKMVAFMCITDKGDLCFLSAKLTREAEFSMVRHFKSVLETEMKRRGVDSVKVYVDKSYTKALSWAEHGGFKVDSELKLNGNTFVKLSYYRQIVAN